MTILTVIMYSLSTAHLALSMQQNLIAFFDQQAADGRLSILNDQGNPLVYCQIAIEVVNVSNFLLHRQLPGRLTVRLSVSFERKRSSILLDFNLH